MGMGGLWKGILASELAWLLLEKLLLHIIAHTSVLFRILLVDIGPATWLKSRLLVLCGSLS